MDAAIVGWRVQDFDAQFVAEDTGIGEEGLSARERVQIGAAHADAMDANERLILADLGDRNIGGSETAGMLKRDLFHGRRCALSRK
jgi:hypothetical protein